MGHLLHLLLSWQGASNLFDMQQQQQRTVTARFRVATRSQTQVRQPIATAAAAAAGLAGSQQPVDSRHSKQQLSS
jgi:hypothetical protein